MFFSLTDDHYPYFHKRTGLPILDWHLCLLLMVPILLALCNGTWITEIAHQNNDWHYYSFFLDYVNSPFVTQLHDYRAVRLSWILKGWLFNKLFPPMFAYYSLLFLIFYTTIIAFYYITKLLFNRNVALLSGTAFTVFCQFHNASDMAWLYPLHDAIANELLALLFLLLATKRPHWKCYLFFAWALFASAIHFAIVLLYGLCVLYWFWYLNKHSQQKHSFLLSLSIFTLGGVIMTLGYCIVNYLAGGDFLFFIQTVPGYTGANIIKAVTSAHAILILNNPDKFKIFNQDLIPTLSMIPMSLFTYFYCKRKKLNHFYKEPILLCLSVFLMSVGFAVAFQWYLIPTLTVRHFILTMAPFLFTAIAAVFAAFLPEKHPNAPNSRFEWVLILTAYIIMVGGLIYSYYVQYIRIVRINIVTLLSQALLIQIGFLIVAMLLLWKNRQIKTYALSLLFTAAIIMFTPVLHPHKTFIWILFSGMLIVSFFNYIKNYQQSMWLRISVTAIFLSIILLEFCHLNKVIAIQKINNLIQNPYWWTFSSFLIFGPIIFWVAFCKPVKKYHVLIWLSSFFVIVNMISASSYLASYLPGFTFYYQSAFKATFKGLSIIRKAGDSYPVFLWFMPNEFVRDMRDDDSKKYLGVAQVNIDLVDVYGAIQAANATYGLANLNNLHSVFTNHNSLVKQLTPAQYKQLFPRKKFEYMINSLPLNNFASHNGLLCAEQESSFDRCSSLYAWFYFFPKPYSIAILTNNLKNIEMGEHLLRETGELFSKKHIYSVKEGPVAFYIAIWKVLEKNKIN